MKSKITLAFAIILIILNIYTIIRLEKIAHNSKHNLAIRYELLALEQEELIRMEKAGMELLQLTETEKPIWDNYILHLEWKLEKYKVMAEKLENSTSSDTWKDELYCDIEMTMTYMDTVANPDNGRALSHDVFKEEIELLNLDINCPFDSSQLHLIRDIARMKGIDNAWSEETCEYVYNGLKQTLKASFELAKSGEKQLYSGTASPWTFYINKVGLEEYSYQLLAVLVIIFTGAVILEERKNRSNKLIEMLPEKRSYIISYYYKLGLISVMSILVITLILPILYFGFKYGFNGLQNPIFVYEQGFTSFTGYTHVQEYSYYGLGKFYGTRPWFEGGYYPATILTIYPLWKVMLFSLVISLLKVIFFTILGVGIGLSFTSVMRSSFALTIISVFYLVSQRFSDKLKYNPFSITSSWDVATGAATYTWFKSAVVLLVSTIIIHIIFHAINERKDYVG